MKDDDMQPIVRVKGEDGIVWYPRYHKNTKGEWELNDKSFQKMFERHMV
jgi:hypothetical protein